MSAIAEKTGYPAEMLDVNLDLEADLGVDTVKQAELFAMVRAHYNIPRQDDLRLSEYNTIQKVIDFIAARARCRANACRLSGHCTDSTASRSKESRAANQR